MHLLGVDSHDIQDRVKRRAIARRRGLCKEKNSKNPRLLLKWVGGSHSDFVVVGKSSPNSPKPVLIFWSSIPCVFCLYIHC